MSRRIERVVVAAAQILPAPRCGLLVMIQDVLAAALDLLIARGAGSGGRGLRAQYARAAHRRGRRSQRRERDDCAAEPFLCGVKPSLRSSER